MSLTQTQMKLANTIASIFFEKIILDKPFINERILEWKSIMPRAIKSDTGSKNLEILDKIDALHRELADHDADHSVYAPIWPPHVQSAFESKLKEFEKLLSRPDIEPSNLNLLRFQRAVLARSSGKYNDAIKEISAANDILNNYIEKNRDKKLPRYERSALLNLGHKSEFYRKMGAWDKAIDLSYEMLEKTDAYISDEAKKQWEIENGFCPIVSWAYYYACEAHLSRVDWDTPEAKDKREYVFNVCFSDKHYKNWTPPTLIQILKNDLWIKRYPDYSEKILNCLYVATAPKKRIEWLRKISTALGRIRLRVGPASATAAAIIIMSYGITSIGVQDDTTPFKADKAQITEFVESGIEQANAFASFAYSDNDLRAVKASLISDIDTFLTKDNPFADAVEMISQQPDESSALTDAEPLITTAGINGNEHGVGPGVIITNII